MVNAGCAAEARAGVEAGAEGIGLLRSELAFLDARGWPTEEEHRRALEPIVAAAGERPVTVRVLDFGGDKLPPFLPGSASAAPGCCCAIPRRWRPSCAPSWACAATCA